MSRKEFSREPVDMIYEKNMIYENAKRISYNKGFLDGYKRGVEDAKEMVEKLAGGEE